MMAPVPMMSMPGQEMVWKKFLQILLVSTTVDHDGACANDVDAWSRNGLEEVPANSLGFDHCRS